MGERCSRVAGLEACRGSLSQRKAPRRSPYAETSLGSGGLEMRSASMWTRSVFPERPTKSVRLEYQGCGSWPHASMNVNETLT